MVFYVYEILCGIVSIYLCEDVIEYGFDVVEKLLK